MKWLCGRLLLHNYKILVRGCVRGYFCPFAMEWCVYVDWCVFLYNHNEMECGCVGGCFCTITMKRCVWVGGWVFLPVYTHNEMLRVCRWGV